jgi:DNA-binding winged helix-turn-helix (wHTH) protein
VAVGVRYLFGDFELDPRGRRLLRAGERVALADRHLDVLHHLVAHAGDILSKDALVAAAWGDVAVTDNSLEQAVSALRRTLGTAADGSQFIETAPRRGYRFSADVTKSPARESDASLEALLAPHRAWVEGRAALETLERDQIQRARQVFEEMLRSAPDSPVAHVGLANACALQFETTRADQEPDAAALAMAAQYARESCRLDPHYGEAWATLGFVLDRSGRQADALAALRRAVTLEPDNWRHHLRLAYASWGEERLRAARRTLALLPAFPLAHWLAATVHVARNVLSAAERELDAGIDVHDRQGPHARFSAVGLHWLRGLVRLARDDDGAAEDFDRELTDESAGHLYGRECCANTWYAIGALHLRRGRLADARLAFRRAIDRVAVHPLAHVALAALSETAGAVPGAVLARPAPARPAAVDTAIGTAAAMTLGGDHTGAAHLVDSALAEAPPGSAGWLLPVEPLLHVAAHPEAWEQVLERLRARSA